MTIEFSRHGKTYQCSAGAPVNGRPPATMRIPFRPCPLRSPFWLELEWRATDDIRGIELYKPVKEVYSC